MIVHSGSGNWSVYGLAISHAQPGKPGWWSHPWLCHFAVGCVRCVFAVFVTLKIWRRSIKSVFHNQVKNQKEGWNAKGLLFFSGGRTWYMLMTFCRVKDQSRCLHVVARLDTMHNLPNFDWKGWPPGSSIKCQRIFGETVNKCKWHEMTSNETSDRDGKLCHKILHTRWWCVIFLYFHSLLMLIFKN